MAKRVKRSKVRTRTKTVTRKIYVSAKRKARAVRRAAGERVTPGEIALAAAGAGVGSIGGSILLAKMPASIPDMAKNAVLAGLGGFVAYNGLKRKNKLFLGLGMGAAAAAATNIIGSLVSGSTVQGQLAAPYRMLAAPYSTLNGASRCLAAPVAAPTVDGEEFC